MKELTKSRSGTEKRQKGLLVTSRYNEGEFAELDAAASRAGVSRAAYQRIQSLMTPPKTRATRSAPVENQTLARLLAQFGKIGSNLNQIAHAANLDNAERFDIQAAVAELRGLYPDMCRALGRKP